MPARPKVETQREDIARLEHMRWFGPKRVWNHKTVAEEDLDATASFGVTPDLGVIRGPYAVEVGSMRGRLGVVSRAFLGRCAVDFMRCCSVPPPPAPTERMTDSADGDFVRKQHADGARAWRAEHGGR